MDDRIIRARIESLRRRAVLRSERVGPWEGRTALHVAVGDYAFDGDWAPVPGTSSWPAGRTLFLRCDASFPVPSAGESPYLSFDLRLLEGLLRVDGRPFAGVDAEHPRVPCPGPGAHHLELEFTCVPAAFHSAEARGEVALLRGARREAVHAATEAFAWDAQFASEAARALRDARRRALVEEALEKALLAVDLTAPEAELLAAVDAARRLLRGFLGAIGADPEAGRVFLTGHSHIDTAWLWPLRETVRKCGRTFSTAVRLMERHPGYRFSCSQPRLYAWAKAYFPELYEEIRALVAAGRWECTGGMWVEADCNIPSGESLVRQVLHGVRFFAAEFGKRPRTCWLPDVFGYPASLPGILAGCGITGFYTNKLHWQARNPFPSHLFHWEGIDGSRVLAHIPRLPEYYNGSPAPAQLLAAWDGFAEKAVHPEVLFPFGHGDGGGGPTEAMLEMAERARGFPGLPATRQGLEETYFDDAVASAPELPTWTGELYLETHRGTYTTQSAIKKANRQNEIGLRDAEIMTALAQILGKANDAAAPDPWPALEAAWEELLLLQFHDILPGSSIGEVYRQALAAHAGIAATVQGAKAAALEGLVAATGVRDPASFTLFNSLSWDRGDPVEVEVPATRGAVEVVLPDGGTVPAQRVEPGTLRGDSPEAGRTRIVFQPGALPSLGLAGFRVRAVRPRAPRSRAEPTPDGGWAIESPLYAITVNPDGEIERLRDKANGREVVPAGQPANVLLLFQDGPEMESAWNIHAVGEKRRYAWDERPRMRVVEEGPVRLVLRIERARRASRIEQDMVIWAEHPRIDFVTRAEWQERQVLLKAGFPVAVRADHATFEVQFGAVARPTHRNTSWEQEKFEVCAHRWMDLSEPGYGVSLLNDSRYGCDVRGSLLRLTLLRGAEWPDPDADRGRHELTYSLLPHAGDWTAAGTVRRAWELNAPPAAMAGAAGPAGPASSFLSIEGPAILQALKRADDGDGWIVRLYEPHGSRGTVTVRGPREFASAMACTHVEENAAPWGVDGGALSFPVGPFQVRSFRVRF